MRMPDDELKEIKELLGASEQLPDDSGITYEDIMSEYRVSAAVSAKPEPKPIEFLEEEDFIKPARQMQEFAEQAESMRPEPEKAKAIEPELTEFSLGPEFDEHFAPKNEYFTPEDGEEAFPEKEKESVLKFIFRRLKKEEETPVLTLQQALVRAQSYTLNLRFRSLLAFALLCPLVLISCAQTWGILPGFLRYQEKPYVTLFFMVVLLLLVMLCGIDVLARGVTDFIHLRPGAETLVVFSCLTSLLQVLSIALRNTKSEQSLLYATVGFLPYCAVAAAAVFFAMRGLAHKQLALARTYKTALAAEPENGCVVSEEKVWSGQPGFARHVTQAGDFVTQAEAPDLSVKVMRFITPLLIIAVIVLAVLAASEHMEGQYFFWALSALSCAGVPMTTFGAFSQVYSRIAARLSHMGAAIAGWQGALEMSRSDTLVLEDGDFFPSGTLALNGLKIIGDHSFETIISFSASLLYASGSGLFKALESIVKDKSGYLKFVSGIEAFEGGVSGNIDGDRVMMGTLNFMHSMGIQVPPELSSKSAVFTSVNHDLAGVLAISYSPATQVKGALLLLEQQKLVNVLAVRDINITPTLLRDKFGINPDLPEYPVVEERVALSDPHRPFHGKVAAILARDGLCPYAESVVGGQRLHRFAVINFCIHMISLVVGMLLVFYFACQTQPVAASAISPANLLWFMFIWRAAQWLISSFVHRY